MQIKKIVLSSMTVAIIGGTSLVFHGTQSFYKEFIQGESYFKAKQYAQALPYLTQAVKIKPDDKQANLYLLLAYQGTGMKKQAAFLSTLLLHKYSSDTAFKTEIADYYYQLSDFAEAGRIYKEVIAVKPLAETQRKLAEVTLWQGNYKEGIPYLQALVVQYPGNLQLKELLADAYSWSNDFANATALYKELVGKKYETKTNLFKLAQVLRYAGKNDEAIRAYGAYLND